MATTTIINKTFDGEFKVAIRHITNNGYDIQYPIVQDDVIWETDRQGSPGKLTFKVYKDNSGNLNFQEGDEAILTYRNEGGDWVTVFHGYIFTKKRNKDNWIDVTAYDQLRYLKNKATYVYTNKKASELIKMIADDYKLKVGTIENSSYVIGSRIEDDQSLFDIIQNALDLTLVSSNDLYVLYAHNGKIYLRDANNMKLDYIINDATAENFEYSSSIDEETYNDIELYYDNDETNKRDYYHAMDTTNINRWGRLRYTEGIQNPSNAEDKVKKMLELYNRKTRKLSVSGAFGDYRCRAGASVIVQLELGDIEVNNYMMIENAKHHFKKNEYRMDLTLSGFNINDGKGPTTYSESVSKVEDTDTTDTNTSTGTNGTNNSTETNKPTDANNSTETITKPTEPIKTYELSINVLSGSQYAGNISVEYRNAANEKITVANKKSSFKVLVLHDTIPIVKITSNNGHSYTIVNPDDGIRTINGDYWIIMDKNMSLNLKWVR